MKKNQTIDTFSTASNFTREFDTENIFMASFQIKSSAATGTLLIQGSNDNGENWITLDSTAVSATPYFVNFANVLTGKLRVNFTAGGAGSITISYFGKGA